MPSSASEARQATTLCCALGGCVREEHCLTSCRDRGDKGDTVKDELHRILAHRMHGDIYEPNVVLAPSPSLPSREGNNGSGAPSPTPAVRIPSLLSEEALVLADAANTVTPPSRAANPIVCNSPFLGGGSEEDFSRGAELGLLDFSPPPLAEYAYPKHRRGRVDVVAQPRRHRSISCPEGGGLICGAA